MALAAGQPDPVHDPYRGLSADVGAVGAGSSLPPDPIGVGRRCAGGRTDDRRRLRHRHLTPPPPRRSPRSHPGRHRLTMVTEVRLRPRQDTRHSAKSQLGCDFTESRSCRP